MFENLTDDSLRIAAVLLDAFSVVILLALLLSLRGVPTKKRRFKHFFVGFCIVGVLTALMNLVCYVLWQQSGCETPFRILAVVNCFFFAAFGLSKTLFVLNYLDNRPANRAVKLACSLIYDVIFLAQLIPPVFRKIYVIEDAELRFGPLHTPFTVLIFAVTALSTAALLWSARALGKRDLILLLAIQIASVVFYALFGAYIPPTIFALAFSILVIYLSIYQRKIFEAVEQEKELTDMRTKVILSQVRPHFLYNTLSSIAYYCKRDAKTAGKLTLDLSDYLRNNLDALDGESDVLFSQELEHTKTYLEIEKVRFGDRLSVEYDITVSNFTLPALTLEPIVENAVKHGVCKKEEGGTVRIATERTEKDVVITVSDDGVGFTPGEKKDDGRSHIGIENVRKRLETLVHGKLEITSAPGAGTTVKIYIPVEVSV